MVKYFFFVCVCSRSITNLCNKFYTRQFSVDWYKDRLSDAQLDELENPKPQPATRVKGAQRRKASRKPARVEVDDDE